METYRKYGRKIWGGILFVAVAGCGGAAGEEGLGQEEEEVGEVSTADATLGGLESVWEAYEASGEEGALEAAGLQAVHVAGHRDDDGYDCDGGGTVTHSFGTRSGGRETGRFEMSYTAAFADCVKNDCAGGSRTLDGDVTGTLTVEYADLTTLERTIRLVHATSGDCSGFTVDGQEIGFEITEIREAVGEIGEGSDTVTDYTGCLCLDPAEGPVCFTNADDLWAQFDPGGICD